MLHSTNPRFLAAILTLSFSMGVSQGLAQSVPNFPKVAVGLPEFRTTAGNRMAGTGFMVKLDSSSPVYFLTSRRLFGPAGGFAKQVSIEEMPGFLKSIRLGSFGASKEFDLEGFKVPITTDPGGPLFDLAAFRVRTAVLSTEALPLAIARPTIGETVWVIAMTKEGMLKGDIARKASVVGADDHWVQVQFENQKADFTGTGGAPVLNAAGEVLGLCVARGAVEGAIRANFISAQIIGRVLRGGPLPEGVLK